MDKESLRKALIAQYKIEIEEAIIESEHVYRSTIDFEILELKMTELIKSAEVNGIEKKIVLDLLSTLIPSYVNYMNYKTSNKNWLHKI